MDLYERAAQLSAQTGSHSELQEDAATLARLIKKEADDLHAAVGGPLRIFEPDWRMTGALAFSTIVVVFGDALVIGSRLRHYLWGWALIVVMTVVAAALVIVVIPTVFQAVRGPKRTIITGIRAEELIRFFGDDIAAPASGSGSGELGNSSTVLPGQTHSSRTNGRG